MNRWTRLGIDLANIINSYDYDKIIKFLRGEAPYCMCFDALKPLYDRYGYTDVNKALLEYDAEKKEAANNE